MRQIFLILNFIFLLFLSSCKTSQVESFPGIPVFIVDKVNSVCAEYKIIDRTTLKFEWVQDHELDMCLDIVGFKKNDFTQVKNWVRDMLKKPAAFEGLN